MREYLFGLFDCLERSGIVRFLWFVGIFFEINGILIHFSIPIRWI